MSTTVDQRTARAPVRVPELDGVRGLAIALVMALHFVNNAIVPTNLLERAAVKLTNYGLWGVDLFFVLSGFLITGILLESKGAPGYFSNFFAKRALRIFPLYYGVLLLLTVLVPVAALRAIDPELLELRRLWSWLWLYLTNVYLGPQTTFSIPYVSHFWSLAVEEHFYLAWPFVIWSLAPRSVMRLCMGLGALALVLRIGFSVVAPAQLFADVLTPCRIDALCAGAWFAVAARSDRGLSTAAATRIAWLSGTLVVTLSVWQFALHLGEAVVLPLRTTALAVFFGAMIFSVTYHDGMSWVKAGLRLGWLRQLGRYSYGLYVFHGMVAYGMLRYEAPAYFSTLTSVHTVGSVLQIAVGVGVSYAIAVLSFHLFESPFLSLKRRFSGAPATARPATPDTGDALGAAAGDAAAHPRPRSASVLINNFNYGQFVGLAIESALAQTHPAQVIVVDDGSTDSSREVIQGFGSRVHAIFQPNGGQGSAMNTGFADATGDIVVFLDADDMLDSTAVASLLAEWQPATVLAQYPLNILNKRGLKVGIHPDPPSSLSQGDVRAELLRTGSFGANVTSGLAFLRRALVRIMPLPASELRNAADGYLVRAVAFFGEVQRLDVPLGSYRRHDSNDSDVCTTPGGLADGFRKKIGYAQKELEVTRQLAERHGFAIESDVGERNAEYVGYRLFLLLTDPGSELVAGCRRWKLLARYVLARWTSGWPLRRRVFAVSLVTVATMSPMPMATTLLRWLHDPASRPGWLYAIAGRRQRS